MNKEQTTKLIVIAGGSKGIGEACTKLFSTNNSYQILVLARNKHNLDLTKLPNVTFISCDVREEGQVARAIKTFDKNNRGIDLLINCIGIAGFGDIGTQPLAVQHNLINTNVLGFLNLLHYTVPQMKNNNHGNIVCLSSIIGRISLDQPFTVYTASKFATNALCEGLRKELAPYNIRVVNISPGVVNTTLTDGLPNVPPNCKRENAASLEANDIANLIYYTYQQPQHIAIKEIVLTNTKSRL